MFDFKNDVKIDMFHLDKEWAKQSELMMMYGEECAKIRREVQKEQERLDVLRASLSSDVRNTPEKYGIAKITESVVENAVVKDTKYQAQMEVLRNIEYEYELLKSAVISLHQKKAALENIVRLQGMSYYSEPTISNINNRIQNGNIE